jgi:hypothetical protein
VDGILITQSELLPNLRWRHDFFNGIHTDYAVLAAYIGR